MVFTCIVFVAAVVACGLMFKHAWMKRRSARAFNLEVRIVQLLLIVVLFSVPPASLGQQKITGTKVNPGLFKSLAGHFSNYSIFFIDAAEFKRYVTGAKLAVKVSLSLPGLTDFDLLLQEHDILANDYQLTASSAAGRQFFPKPACITYAGVTGNDSSSRVRLTITDDFLYGIIASGRNQYFIEPMKYFDTTASGNLFLVYKASDAKTDPTLVCGVTEKAQAEQKMIQSGKIAAGVNCVRTRMAIASDQSMFLRYRSVSAVQVHNIGVMNNVIWNYTNAQFNDNIEFVIAGQNVSTAVANDQLSPAYTGTNSSTILGNFKAWGQAGNFGFVYDIGQLWTTRNIDGDGAGVNSGIIGLTYVGAVCTTSRYQLLEDFAGANGTGSGYALAVMVTHETGHSFNCVHDAAGTPFIMAPSVANVNTWSGASVTAVNAFVPTRTCLQSCAFVEPLAANFISSPQAICVGGSMQFTDRTLGGPNAWRWSFEGGTPLTSGLRNPVVSFATSGVKNVVLSTATETNFSVKGASIIVTDPPAAACFPSGTGTSNAGINSFTLNTIDKTSMGLAGDGSKYLDFSCTDNTILAAGTLYNATANVGTTVPANAFNVVQFFIDYNNDGDFDDADEFVYASAQCWIGNHSFPLATPAAPPVLNQLLRARLIARDCTGGVNACYNPTAGQVEDYGVMFLSPPSSCDINYWTGSVNKAWENPSNWSCGTVPNAATRVIIGEGKVNYPEVKSAAVCKSLHNSSNTSVTVFAGFSLNVVGAN